MLAGCHDGVSPAKPSSIEVVSGATQVGVAGQTLAVTPSFVVRDERGRAIAGVPVTVAVTAGGGILADAPTTTTDAPATTIGKWSMGARVGRNELSITVAGLAPIAISATSNPGAPARLVPLTALSIAARVGDVIVPAPRARLSDVYDNPIASAEVRINAQGGGTAPVTVTTDAQGDVDVGSWTLGPVTGQNVLTLVAGTATVSFIADARPGDPANISTIAGAGQAGRAGALIDTPIRLRVDDRFGNAIADAMAVFEVTSGNGTLASTSATVTSGIVTLPAWTLGRTALPQRVHAVVGTASGDVTVDIKTDFEIDVRFWGPPMTAEQQALFTNAAARLSAIITADVPDVPATPLNLGAYCGISGLPVLNETLDDVMIYASIQEIDGPSKILARAGPCLFRGPEYGSFAAFGMMEFDIADIDRMLSMGTMQDVITHEMLHVLGIGTAWGSRLLSGAGTSASTYVGSGAKQACLNDGGVSTCGGGVPVENNGVMGTADAHWRETVFQTELMTGYSSPGGMPLSAITVGALADLGYVVNVLAADPFRVPGAGALRSSIGAPASEWEAGLPVKAKIVP